MQTEITAAFKPIVPTVLRGNVASLRREFFFSQFCVLALQNFYSFSCAAPLSRFFYFRCYYVVSNVLFSVTNNTQAARQASSLLTWLDAASNCCLLLFWSHRWACSFLCVHCVRSTAAVAAWQHTHSHTHAYTHTRTHTRMACNRNVVFHI